MKKHLIITILAILGLFFAACPGDQNSKGVTDAGAKTDAGGTDTAICDRFAEMWPKELAKLKDCPSLNPGTMPDPAVWLDRCKTEISSCSSAEIALLGLLMDCYDKRPACVAGEEERYTEQCYMVVGDFVSDACLSAFPLTTAGGAEGGTNADAGSP